MLEIQQCVRHQYPEHIFYHYHFNFVIAQVLGFITGASSYKMAPCEQRSSFLNINKVSSSLLFPPKAPLFWHPCSEPNWTMKKWKKIKPVSGILNNLFSRLETWFVSHDGIVFRIHTNRGAGQFSLFPCSMRCSPFVPRDFSPRLLASHSPVPHQWGMPHS